MDNLSTLTQMWPIGVCTRSDFSRLPDSYLPRAGDNYMVGFSQRTAMIKPKSGNQSARSKEHETGQQAEVLADATKSNGKRNQSRSSGHRKREKPEQPRWPDDGGNRYRHEEES